MIRWQLLLVIYSSFVSASYVKKNNEENQFKPIRTWELGSGKYFNIKSDFSRTEKSENSSIFPFEIEIKEGQQYTLHFHLFGTEILFRELTELRFRKECMGYPTDVCEYPRTVLERGTNTFTIIHYNDNEPKESNFRTNFHNRDIGGTYSDHYTLEIMDEQNNLFLPIFEMKNNYSSEHPNTNVEIPLLNTTIKLSTEFNWPKTKVELNFNNKAKFVDRSIIGFDNVSLDNFFGNERVSKLRENAIKSIFLSQDVPKSYKAEEQSIQFKSEKLNFLVNLTTSDIETQEKERWILLEAESTQWPQLNFVWNMLQMSQNETNWGAGFGKSSWNQATWRKNSINGPILSTNFVFTTHFNSDFPIASAVLTIDDTYSTGDLVLNSQETQWILKFENSPRGYSVMLSRTEIWTQNVRPITLLEISYANTEFPESVEQTSKLVISHYRNFKSFVETMSESFSKLQVDKLLQALWKDRLLAKVLDVVAVAFGGTLREDLMKGVDNLESVVKEALTVVSKDFLNLVKDNSGKLKDIFIISLRFIGGDYIEEEDQIVILHNKDTLFQKLPSVLSKELSNHFEQLF